MSAAPNIEMIAASLRSCNLGKKTGGTAESPSPSSVMSSSPPASHLLEVSDESAGEVRVEFISDTALPFPWEQCLDMRVRILNRLPLLINFAYFVIYSFPIIDHNPLFSQRSHFGVLRPQSRYVLTADRGGLLHQLGDTNEDRQGPANHRWLLPVRKSPRVLLQRQLHRSRRWRWVRELRRYGQLLVRLFPLLFISLWFICNWRARQRSSPRRRRLPVMLHVLHGAEVRRRLPQMLRQPPPPRPRWQCLIEPLLFFLVLWINPTRKRSNFFEQERIFFSSSFHVWCDQHQKQSVNYHPVHTPRNCLLLCFLLQVLWQ